MNAIDIHSGCLYSVPLKSKSIGDVLQAFKKTMKVMGNLKNLNTDLEAAVMGHEFQEYLRKNGIRDYPVDPQKKRNNAIVERIKRTLREMITKYI